MTAAAGVPTVILCGGRGTRIRDAGPPIPKPMVAIGGQPILWHIMKIYAAHGFTDFVLALGYPTRSSRSSSCTTRRSPATSPSSWAAPRA